MLKKILIIFFLILVLFLETESVFAETKPANTIAEAVVLQKNKVETKIKIINGSLNGKELSVKNVLNNSPFSPKYEAGNHVVVTISKNPDGKIFVYISDIDRKPILIFLFALFLAVTIIVARWQGLLSFLSMVFSFYIITSFIIPNIIAGTDPVIAVTLGAILFIPASFLLSHGINKKTFVAIISTFIVLILAGILAAIFINRAGLTGFATEEAGFLTSVSDTSHINIKSLLIAGIIIGFLAILDDITISQASVIENIYRTNDRLTFKELYKRGMAVGRDHIASLVNTLILVYVGASLPLILLFYNNPAPFGLIINQEIIATEIIRSLIGSIGIILAVPISTFLACLSFKK